MPTYEYVCLKCGHRFDLLQSISAKRIDKCPKCDGKVKRLISAGSGLIFKGTGFYATDYKKNKGGSSCHGSGGSDCASCPHTKKE